MKKDKIPWVGAVNYAGSPYSNHATEQYTRDTQGHKPTAKYTEGTKHGGARLDDAYPAEEGQKHVESIKKTFHW